MVAAPTPLQPAWLAYTGDCVESVVGVVVPFITKPCRTDPQPTKFGLNCPAAGSPLGLVMPNAVELHHGFGTAGLPEPHGSKKFVKLPGRPPNPAMGINGA